MRIEINALTLLILLIGVHFVFACPTQGTNVKVKKPDNLVVIPPFMNPTKLSSHSHKTVRRNKKKTPQCPIHLTMTEKHQYEPDRVIPNPLEECESPQEEIQGATYEHGSEIKIVSKPSFIMTNQKIVDPDPAKTK